MISKSELFTSGRALAALLAPLVFTASAALAQSKGHVLGDVPAWVRSSEWTLPENASPDASAEGVRYLLYERQDNPALRERFERTVMLMRNETGVQDSGSLSFDYDPSYEQLILHRVTVHRQGRALDRLDASKLRVIQQEAGLGGHIYTGEQSILLFVEDLRVGDALEYSFTVRGANPILDGHYASRFVVRSGVAVDRQRFRIVWPEDRPLHVRQHLVPEQPAVTDAETGREYLWDFNRLDPIPYEDYRPAGHEPYPYVETSDFESWTRVVEWALPLYRVDTEALPVELNELLESWKAENLPQDELALRALQFVQDELRYTGIELGPDSYKPASPAETFQRRYGDCKAKVHLFCAMLTVLGIEAHPALVNSYAENAVGRRLASPFAFNHVIARVTLGGRAAWVDPTLSHQGGRLWERHLPRMGKALVIGQGVGELSDLPVAEAGRALRRVVATYRFRDYEEPVRLTVQTFCHGSEADDMREFLARSDREELATDYLNYYARYHTGVEGDGELRWEDNREENVLKLVEHYRIREFWEPEEEGSGRLTGTFYADHLEYMLPDPDVRLRQSPLRIPHPLRYEQENLVYLPDGGWSIPTLSDEVEHEAFSFRFHRELKGNMVRFHYECETRLAEIAANQVPGYLRKYEEMMDLLGDTLFRPDTGSQHLLGQLNWLMIAITGLAGFIAAAGAAWFWWFTRPAERGYEEPPVIPEHPQLQGLGGWLILVGLGICVAPVVRALVVLQNWEGWFSDYTWQAVAMPGGEEFHPLFAPLLIFEATGNAVLMVLNVLVMLLFFRKRKVFPGVYIAMLAVNVLFLLIDELAGAQIPFIREQDDGTSMRGLWRAFTGAIIWTCYMLRSRRVAATFVR